MIDVELMLNKLVKERLAFEDKSGSGRRNCDVYEKRLTRKPRPVPGYDKVPHCIYFYYVRIDSSGKIRVDHYIWPSKKPREWVNPIAHGDVGDIILKLVDIARPRSSYADKRPFLLGSKNFREVPWKHKSYIAIFVDEKNWHFVRRRGRPRRPSIAFDPNSGFPNHSFFDAKDVVLDVPVWNTHGTDKRSAVYFVNHMKRNNAGDDLQTGEKQAFKFNMNFIAQYVGSSRPGAAIVFDPGGTNMGPPLPPP